MTDRTTIEQAKKYGEGSQSEWVRKLARSYQEVCAERDQWKHIAQEVRGQRDNLQDERDALQTENETLRTANKLTQDAYSGLESLKNARIKEIENERDALQAKLDDELGVLRVIREALALPESADVSRGILGEIEKLKSALAKERETWFDGEKTWTRPTAWAYAQACKLINGRQLNAKKERDALQVRVKELEAELAKTYPPDSRTEHRGDCGYNLCDCGADCIDAARKGSKGE